MGKTTIYLPAEMLSWIERTAEREGCSRSRVIRQAIQSSIDRDSLPRPRIPLGGELGGPTVSERVEELLHGFGGD